MWLEWCEGRISFIRDYRNARYVADDAELALDATSHGDGTVNYARRDA
ncbi:hypothetical protein [Mesorhizobium sp. M1227]